MANSGESEVHLDLTSDFERATANRQIQPQLQLNSINATMKMKLWIHPAALGLTAVALAGLGNVSALAASLPLNGEVTLRPLTPQEIKDYSLAGKQGASGLSTIGVGQPAYLDAMVNSDIAPSNILSVTWELTGKPAGSSAIVTNSPLGNNVPLYKGTDRQISQLAGRAMMVPDVSGQYEVTASISTDGSGATNVVQKITVGTFLGANSCALCHSGGVVAPDTYHPWSQTPHASAFSRKIDGLDTDHFGPNCVSCHVLGYDTNPNAVNGGFDDVAKAVGWVFPAVETNGNWAAMAPELRNVSNIQCESCHGPGSEHAYSLGDTNKISVSVASGACSQCHDSLTHHFKTAEWNNSKHASAVEETAASCSRCHTGQGFVNYVSGKPAVAVAYEGITCAACHDPHDASTPHQLRDVGTVTLMDGSTVTNGGAGRICMECHMSRQNAATYVETTSGSNRFGPHHGPQSDMLAGVNAVTYGKTIPSSAHRGSVEDSCVECHMQDIESGAAFTHAGGHTFSMKWDAGTPETTADDVELTESCAKCHGEIESFDLKRQDYDGDGVVEGVQTEIKGLLGRLAYLLPPVNTPKEAIAINSSWSRQQLRAGFNYQFVLEDGSFGVHNTAYAVGLLKASIADLTGDGNNDGLSDTWQQQYFGSTSSPDAAPNATPAGDGIPNWLKYSLGLDPLVKGVNVDGGVVWANGTSLGGGTNTLQIFTAAEVSFNTEIGKTYQLQGISSLGGGWQNIGNPIAGTGAAMSYVTPTRGNVQQYFRIESY